MSDCSCDTALRARRGVTFSRQWRYATDPLVYKAVAAVLSPTPLTLTVIAHGVINGQSVALVELGGLDSVNARNSPPKGTDFHAASVDDVDTLHFNDIDAASGGQVYESGGKIAYYTLVDLSTITGVQFKVYGVSDPTTVIATFNTTLDNTAKTISLSIAPSDLANLTSDDYTFTLVATFGSGDVKALAFGTFTLIAAGSPDAA
jgi:hypothetical protein